MIYFEWMAFGLGAIAVWQYGQSVRRGAILGAVSAATFILWGAMSGIWAAATVNLGFLALHLNNLRRGNAQ